MKILFKISLFLFIMLFLSLFLLGLFIFISADEIIQDHVITKLNVIADLKVDIIKHYFDDLKFDITVLQGYNSIRESIPILNKFADDTKNPEFIAAEKRLNIPLSKWTEGKKEIVDIMLVSPAGDVVYSENPEHQKVELRNHLSSMDSLAFEEGKKGIHFSEIFSTKQIEDPARKGEQHKEYDFGMLVSAPVYDSDNKFVGVVVLELDMAPFYKTIQDTTGLKTTGETLVAKKFGDELLMLNPLRFAPDAALKLRIKMGGQTGTALQTAVLSGKGSGRAIDYRGREVVAAWRYLPNLNWAMVAKIDRNEAFDSIDNLRNTVLIVGLIIVLVSLFIGSLLSKSISQPIEKITQNIKDISMGKINIEIDNLIKNSEDEVGELARAFERTIVSLKLAIKKSGIKKEVSVEKEIGAEDLAKTGFVKQTK